jgi:hypothetical protein
VARAALDADIVIAFRDPGDDQHATAVAELRPRLAAGDKLLAVAIVTDSALLTLDKKLRHIAGRARPSP